MSTTGSLPPAVPLAITPTFSPWTHTSDDSYIYQLSLVLAAATVSYFTPSPSVRALVYSLSREQGVYEGLGGSAGAPLTSQSNSSTQQAVDDDNRREASMGEGRRAVAILLHQMLSAAKHDTVMINFFMFHGGLAPEDAHLWVA